MNAVIETNNKATTPMAMINLAIEKGADVDQLSKLMDLQERWEAREAKRAFIAAKEKFQKTCPEIPKKEKSNNGFYSPLAATMKLVQPSLTECGLSFEWKNTQENGWITVVCVLTHTQGHSEQSSLSLQNDMSGNKQPVHALVSAKSYGKRLTFEDVLGICTMDSDDDGDKANGVVTTEQVKEIQEALKKHNKTAPDLCRKFKFDSLVAIPKSRFNEVMIAIKAPRVKK